MHVEIQTCGLSKFVCVGVRWNAFRSGTELRTRFPHTSVETIQYVPHLLERIVGIKSTCGVESVQQTFEKMMRRAYVQRWFDAYISCWSAPPRSATRWLFPKRAGKSLYSLIRYKTPHQRNREPLRDTAKSASASAVPFFLSFFIYSFSIFLRCCSCVSNSCTFGVLSLHWWSRIMNVLAFLNQFGYFRYTFSLLSVYYWRSRGHFRDEDNLIHALETRGDSPL